MMGQLPGQQNALFYEFCLEKHIPTDHLLRQIDQFLNFDVIRKHLQDFYSHTGRPSIDPELMIRMLLIGYCYGIRSERRLCEEIRFNLAYRWFCRLGLEDEVPDHSTFSKNRHGRFREADLLRFVFDRVVQRCDDEGLIKGEGFATDASYIKADASRQRMVDGPVDWQPDPTQSRAVREYLDALESDPLARRTQKKVSTTDPMAQWAGDKGPGQFYYSNNYLIDIDHNVIVDVESTPSHRIAEVSSTQTMIDRVEENLDIKPDRLIADTAYGSAAMLDWVVEEKQIEPHIPVLDKSEVKPGIFSQSDFIWDSEADCYHCPGDNRLQSRRRNFKKSRSPITKANTIIYRSSQHDCRTCKLKPRCCPNTTFRKITRSIYESSRDVAREISETQEYLQSRKDRKKVEVLFAHLKRIMNFDRLRLRGITGAHDEFLLAATVQNLKKLAQQRYKPPDYRMGAPALC
ncbi:MAG: transposase [Gammaproteobacteria bacterium]|nr:transposase [Gammaproteobacteria bacterium]